MSLDTSLGRDHNMFRMQDTFRIHGRRLVPPPRLDSIMENVSGASSPERSTRPSALFESVQNATSMSQKSSSPKPQPHIQPMAPPPPTAPPPAETLKAPTPSSQDAAAGVCVRVKKVVKKKTEGKTQKAKTRKPTARRAVKRSSGSGSSRVRPARRVRLPIKKAPAPPPPKPTLPPPATLRELAKVRSRERGWDPETRSIYQQNLVERLAMPKMPHTERVSMSIHPGSMPTDLLRTDEDKRIWARWHPPRTPARTLAEEPKKKVRKRKDKGEGAESSDTENEILAQERATLKRGSKVPSHRVVSRRKKHKSRGARTPRSASTSNKVAAAKHEGDVAGAGAEAEAEAAFADGDFDDSESTEPKRPAPVPPKAALHLARITTRPRSEHMRHPATGYFMRPPDSEQTQNPSSKRRPSRRSEASDRAGTARNACTRATAANTRMRLRRAILAATKAAAKARPAKAVHLQGRTPKGPTSTSSSAVEVSAAYASAPKKSPSLVVAPATLPPHQHRKPSRVSSAAPSTFKGGGGKKVLSAPPSKRPQANAMRKLMLDKRALAGEASVEFPVTTFRWQDPYLPSDLVEALGPAWTNAAEAYLRRRGMAPDERATYRSAHRVSGASRTLRRLGAGLSSSRTSAHPVAASAKVASRPSVVSPSVGMPVAVPAVLHPTVAQPLPSARRAHPAVPKQSSGRVRFVSPRGSEGAGGATLGDRSAGWAEPVAAPHGVHPSKGSAKGAHELKTIKAPRPEQYLKNVSSDDEAYPGAVGERTQRMPPPPTLPRLAALFAATGGSQNNAVRRLVMGGRAAKTRPFLQSIEPGGPKSDTPESAVDVDRRLLGRLRHAPAVRV